MKKHAEQLVARLFPGRADQKAFKRLVTDDATRLFRRQPDGTLTTELVPVDVLERRWGGRREQFWAILGTASQGEWRLLRKQPVRLGGGEREAVSLGHDALARIAADWDEEFRRRSRRLRWVGGLAAALLAAAVFFVLALFAWENAEQARKDRDKADEAARIAKDAAEGERSAKRAAERQAAVVALGRGLDLIQQGQVGAGALSLSYALEGAHRVEDLRLEEDIRRQLGDLQHQLHPLVHLLVHRGEVRAIDVSPTTNRVAMAVGDQVHVWDINTGNKLYALAHRGPVHAVAFRPDGEAIVTGSGSDQRDRGGEVRLWDAASGTPRTPPLPHTGPVDAVVFTPDGQAVLALGADAVSAWDASAGTPIWERRQSKEVRFETVISRDGRSVATITEEWKVRVWHPANGDIVPLATEIPHPGAVKAIAFSPDGKLLVTAGSDKTARLWDAATGRAVGDPLPHDQTVVAVTFSADGKKLMTASSTERDTTTTPSLAPPGERGGRTVRVWDVETRRAIGPPIPDQFGFVNDAQTVPGRFSPSGRLMATKSGKSTVQLWEVETGRPVGEPLHHDRTVGDVTFGRDDTLLTRLAADETVRVWAVAPSGRREVRLPATGRLTRASFSPDGKLVFTAGDDGTGQLWNASTGERAGGPLRHIDHLTDEEKRSVPIPAERGRIHSHLFSPDGKVIATASNNYICLWKTDTAQIVGKPIDSWPFGHMYFSREGEIFMTDEPNHPRGGRVFRMWNVNTAQPCGELPKTAGEVKRISHDGRVIATVAGRVVFLWDSATGNRICELGGDGDEIAFVDFDVSGKIVLVCSRTGPTARLWDVDTRKPIGPPLGLSGRASRARFNPDGKTVLIGCDRTAQLWDVASGAPVGVPLRHAAAIANLGFSRDSRTLVTFDAESNARFWEASTGKPRGALISFTSNQRGDVNGMTSPDGKTVCLARSNELRFCDPNTGRQVGASILLPVDLWGAQFSPDGRSVVTAGEDKVVRTLSVPEAIEGDPKQIATWVRVATSQEMDEEGGIRFLEPDEWEQQRRRLDKLGGPPRLRGAPPVIGP
jgi:WD40 repeat protein